MVVVVPDTNTLVSGLLWSGPPGLLLKGAIDGRWQLCSAQELLAELEAVIRCPKFQARWQRLPSSVEQTLGSLRAYIKIVPITLPPSVRCTDPNDDVFLACAESALADYLVTGDAHLLAIQQIARTRIVTVRTFLGEQDTVDGR